MVVEAFIRDGAAVGGGAGFSSFPSEGGGGQ